MFIDYYAILEVDLSASQEEIKAAFKQQAFRWHPDRNIGLDTTLRMQQINEAYLFLKDKEKRERYDKEYIRFKQYQQKQVNADQEKERKQGEKYPNRERERKQYERHNMYSEYSVQDDILNKWMENARKQAVNLAKKTIDDFEGISKAGAKAIASEAVAGIGRYLIVSMIIMIVFGIAKSCNG